eukprot:Mrub_06067.p1 GENE.Mrub_06067~~Mrub_06067.p1  ORF type:complete len:348 (-),score=71.44 Mrub_06067:9-926(-)
MLIVLILIVYICDNYTSHIKYARAYQISLMTLTMFIAFGISAAYVNIYKVGDSWQFDVWFNGDGLSIKTMMVGMVSNFIFGMIDNGGLFFGASYLDEWFSVLPGADDANVFAGYGNTYSDLLGSFLGTFFGLMIEDLTGVSSTPIWGDAIGIITGCLAGIAIPVALVGDSQNIGLNKISSCAAIIGDYDEDQLNSIIHGQDSILKFRAMSAFKNMDQDNSGYLDLNEVKSYLQTCLGDEYDEDTFDSYIKQFFDYDEDGDANKFTYDEFEKIYLKLAVNLYNDNYYEEGEIKYSINDKYELVQGK